MSDKGSDAGEEVVDLSAARPPCPHRRAQAEDASPKQLPRVRQTPGWLVPRAAVCEALNSPQPELRERERRALLRFAEQRAAAAAALQRQTSGAREHWRSCCCSPLHRR